MTDKFPQIHSSAAPGKGQRLTAFAGQALRSAGRLLAALATPPACRHCGAPLLGHDNPFLCPDCLSSVEWIGDGACRGCGYPAGPHADLGDSCRHCRNADLSLTAAAAVLRYTRAGRSLVTALKFRGETELAKPMGKMLAIRAKKAGFPLPDLILPIPLHPVRFRIRGFNQAEFIAASAAESLGVRLEKRLLRKKRHTDPQSTLHKKDRIENVKGAYHCAANLDNAKILLIDDVITTGATMAECAKACRAAGAKRVYALSFAR